MPSGSICAKVLPMPAKPTHLKPLTPAPKRPAGIPDPVWALPTTLALLSQEHDFYQKDVANAANVDQSTVSRWLNYQGLVELAATKILRIERGLNLPTGALLPQADPQTLSVRDAAIALGIAPSVVLALGDLKAGERMKAFTPEASRAIMGIVHVYQLTLDQAATIAQRVSEDLGALARSKAMDAPTWYDRMRRIAESAASESGQHPRVGKIDVPRRASK